MLSRLLKQPIQTIMNAGQLRDFLDRAQKAQSSINAIIGYPQNKSDGEKIKEIDKAMRDFLYGGKEEKQTLETIRSIIFDEKEETPAQ